STASWQTGSIVPASPKSANDIDRLRQKYRIYSPQN
ncbi:MAG: hypothetical protein K0Q70_2942, partial [Rhodospirillales bacterium]|nr:hypothetical protein [Rhodospirillales bacterium]